MHTTMGSEDFIFLFHSPNESRFSGGVFTTKELAERWIEKHKLTGVLSKYPIDNGVYDWAIKNGKFIPKKEKHFSPSFIGGFSSAAQEHYHYEEGTNLDD